MIRYKYHRSAPWYHPQYLVHTTAITGLSPHPAVMRWFTGLFSRLLSLSLLDRYIRVDGCWNDIFLCSSPSLDRFMTMRATTWWTTTGPHRPPTTELSISMSWPRFGKVFYNLTNKLVIHLNAKSHELFSSSPFRKKDKNPSVTELLAYNIHMIYNNVSSSW